MLTRGRPEADVEPPRDRVARGRREREVTPLREQLAAVLVVDPQRAEHRVVEPLGAPRSATRIVTWSNNGERSAEQLAEEALLSLASFPVAARFGRDVAASAPPAFTRPWPCRPRHGRGPHSV